MDVREGNDIRGLRAVTGEKASGNSCFRGPIQAGCTARRSAVPASFLTRHFELGQLNAAGRLQGGYLLIPTAFVIRKARSRVDRKGANRAWMIREGADL